MDITAAIMKCMAEISATAEKQVIRSRHDEQVKKVVNITAVVMQSMAKVSQTVAEAVKHLPHRR